MRPDLDDAICRDFPALYKDRHGDMRQTCMMWGFEVGDGWHGIIRELSAALTHATASDRAYTGRAKAADRHLECGFYVVADQVKEKYGTLSFYYHAEPKPGVKPEDVDKDYAKEVAGEVSGLVSMADRMSAITCELCGSPGKVRGRGWLKCLCGVCAQAEGYGGEAEEGE